MEQEARRRALIHHHRDYSRDSLLALFVEARMGVEDRDDVISKLKEQTGSLRALAESRGALLDESQGNLAKSKRTADEWREKFITANAQARHFNSLSRIMRLVWAVKHAPFHVI